MRFAFPIKLDSHAHEILSKGAIAFILKIMAQGWLFCSYGYCPLFGSIWFRSLFSIAVYYYFCCYCDSLGMDNSVTRFVSAYAVNMSGLR